MSDHFPQTPPGHLDTDAVSAFIDRDFGPSDLTTIESHLAQCPACYREVLEIRTAVILLAGLPQYQPRRSFCLGHEHARASHRPGRHASDYYFPAGASLPAQPPLGPPGMGPARGAAWLPGLHAAALVVAALLLLVTVGDLTGLAPGASGPTPLAAPTALAQSQPPAEMPAPESMPLARVASEPVADEAAFAAPTGTAAPMLAVNPRGGTVGEDGASQGVPAGDASAPRLAATVVVASVTQAVSSRSPREREPGAPAIGSPATAGGGQPSRIRMLELTLAIVLAWLVVCIAGMRGLRRPR